MKAANLKKNLTLILIIIFFIVLVGINFLLFFKVREKKQVSQEQAQEIQLKEREKEEYIEAKALGDQIRQVISEQASLSAQVKPECLFLSDFDPDKGAAKVTSMENNNFEYFYNGQVFGYEEEIQADCQYSTITLGVVNINEQGEKKGEKIYLILPSSLKDEAGEIFPSFFKGLTDGRRVWLYLTYEQDKINNITKVVSWRIDRVIIR